MSPHLLDGIRIATLFSILLVSLEGVAVAQPAIQEGRDAAGEESDETDAPANPLDLDQLLEDPLPNHPEFLKLRNRLVLLSEEGRTPSDFQVAAEELANAGAYTTAIELLWFAQQMESDESVSKEYGDQMRSWAQSAKGAESLADEAGQLFLAGRKPESIETFLRVIEAHPLSERAHFRLADAWRRIYEEEYGADTELPPLQIRVRVFRDAYEHYLLALAIDPLFYDAWYGLSELRGLLPDNAEFLLRTQNLTQHALDFRGEVLPVLENIERGESDASTFMELGKAFEALGAFEYAAFAYQCARLQGAPEAEVSASLEILRTRTNKTGVHNTPETP